jgi:hypothetical protein
MKEYWIKIAFAVDARDEDEAREIAAKCREAIEKYHGQPYAVRDLETDTIREA